MSRRGGGSISAALTVPYRQHRLSFLHLSRYVTDVLMFCRLSSSGRFGGNGPHLCRMWSLLGLRRFSARNMQIYMDLHTFVSHAGHEAAGSVGSHHQHQLHGGPPRAGRRQQWQRLLLGYQARPQGAHRRSKTRGALLPGSPPPPPGVSCRCSEASRVTTVTRDALLVNPPPPHRLLAVIKREFR